MNSTLQAGEDLAARGAVAPRVTLEGMKARVVSTEYYNPNSCRHLTIAIVTLDNGWVLVGKSAPASVENFDAEKGQTFAFDDAIRQLWTLEGYLLREGLWLQQRDRAEA